MGTAHSSCSQNTFLCLRSAGHRAALSGSRGARDVSRRIYPDPVAADGGLSVIRRSPAASRRSAPAASLQYKNRFLVHGPSRPSRGETPVTPPWGPAHLGPTPDSQNIPMSWRDAGVDRAGTLTRSSSPRSSGGAQRRGPIAAPLGRDEPVVPFVILSVLTDNTFITPG